MALRPATLALLALAALAPLPLASCASAAAWPAAQGPAAPIKPAAGETPAAAKPAPKGTSGKAAPVPATATAKPAAPGAASPKTPAASPKTPAAPPIDDGSPDAVFDAAKALFDQKAYEPAIEGFHAYRKAARKEFEAKHDAWEEQKEARVDKTKPPPDAPRLPPRVAESLYWQGIAESEAGEKSRAHDLFREILTDHKSFPEIADVVRRDYEIGLAFIEEKAERPVPLLPFFHMKSASLGAETLQFLIESYQQRSFDYAQFQLGEYHLERRDWRRAADAFSNVEEGWRDGPWAGPAQVRRATCYLRQSRGHRYDPTPVDRAEEILLDYLRKNPTGSRIQEAEVLLREIREGRAALHAENARFYLFRERRPRAALVYVHALVRETPGTLASERAPELIEDVIALSEGKDPACADEARELLAEIARRKERKEGPPHPPSSPILVPPGGRRAPPGRGR